MAQVDQHWSLPPGPLQDWLTPPFTPTEQNGFLYGRGAADMKGSLAAMLTASQRFLQQNSSHQGQLAFLITSDEEGIAKHGTKKVVDWLINQNKSIDWCIVGEPSSSDALGDVIKNGRRGSLNATLTVLGKQGHIAYPQLAENPIHTAIPFLNELTNVEWDQGNAFFQPTSLQISNIHAGSGTTNVISGSLTLQFNFRFSPEVTHNQLQERVEELLAKHHLTYQMEWQLSGQPFLTKPGKLLSAASSAIESVTGISPELSTNGGTSDGRFIATLGCEVIELGPCNQTIHQVNECIKTNDLDQLSLIYEHIMQKLL